MPVLIFTQSNDGGGRVVVIHQTDEDSIAYRFSLTENHDGKTASLLNVIGAEQGDDVAEAVTEALEARGYTVETDITRADGGRPADSLQRPKCMLSGQPLEIDEENGINPASVPEADDHD